MNNLYRFFNYFSMKLSIINFRKQIKKFYKCEITKNEKLNIKLMKKYCQIISNNEGHVSRSALALAPKG